MPEICHVVGRDIYIVCCVSLAGCHKYGSLFLHCLYAFLIYMVEMFTSDSIIYESCKQTCLEWGI